MFDYTSLAVFLFGYRFDFSTVIRPTLPCLLLVASASLVLIEMHGDDVFNSSESLQIVVLTWFPNVHFLCQ